jgi:2-amino-4-hydroxy-6-hydroxymethyldihydropteridine diphosphokinase
MPDKLLVLLLGSNLGNRSGNLHHACLLIGESIGPIASVSSVYETAPWGYDSQNDFLNQCVTVWSSMDPGRIMDKIHLIEAKVGRKQRCQEYADRLIDIDILLYGDVILSRPDLRIPHQNLQDRRFSLVPLAEILPDFEHPILNKKISTLLRECLDDLPVKRMEADQPNFFKQG